MKRVFLLIGTLCLVFVLSFSFAKDSKIKIIMLISEQNINGPQKGWWASEIDLSTAEARIASYLINQGFEILEPSEVNKIIRKERAFRIVDLSETSSVRLGRLASADYIILGKAVASSGGKVPQSSMLSCFANIITKLIRVKDGKVVDYLDASGNSAHLDVVSGGKEALIKAADNLAVKIAESLNREGGK